LGPHALRGPKLFTGREFSVIPLLQPLPKQSQEHSQEHSPAPCIHKITSLVTGPQRLPKRAPSKMYTQGFKSQMHKVV